MCARNLLTKHVCKSSNDFAAATLYLPHFVRTREAASDMQSKQVKANSEQNHKTHEIK